MRPMKVGLCLAVLLLSMASGARAQSTTGTISGRVSDAQGLAMPGVTVTATSPNLQGSRETVTSANGDYILSLLPSGAYTVTFSLSGFDTQTRAVTVAPTQVVPLEVEMGVAALSETVQVVGLELGFAPGQRLQRLEREAQPPVVAAHAHVVGHGAPNVVLELLPGQPGLC